MKNYQTFLANLKQHKSIRNNRWWWLFSRQRIICITVLSSKGKVQWTFAPSWYLRSISWQSRSIRQWLWVWQLIQLLHVKRNDATSLRHLINHVTSNMNAIQALALNTSMQDLMLNHLLLSVLDSETHKEWEIQTATQQDIPTMATVIDFLEARCKALEVLQANQSKSTTTSQQSPQDRTKVSQSSWCNLANQQCPLCKGTHRLIECSKCTR